MQPSIKAASDSTARRDHGTDALLLEQFLAAPSEASFERVCEWLAPRLMRFFRTRGCDNSTSEELTQDVLFTVYRQSDTIRDRQMFRPWVYTVARNCLLQNVRRAKRRVQLIGVESGDLQDLDAVLPAPPVSHSFAELIGDLGRDEQEALTLRYVDELEYGEISSILKIPVGTAKWRVFNAKLKLALQLRRRPK